VPSIEGTSGLSAHLRFGTVSIRACVREARKHEGNGAATWLSELVWRDFYHMILSQFPHVGHGRAFREEYDKIKWPGKPAHFEAWRTGRTGFPLVDASMRHFNATGWMHNRMRMVVASFLTKDLLIDWRRGEEVFALGLLDFDFASNNGGWQWSASTGCDAQPYFRVFNPESQSRRFDPEGKFIKSVLPELRDCSAKRIHAAPGVKGYPEPIVEHSIQRDKAIALFKKS
jgi:deoxyribodipyrimidine photo-lyase